MDDLILLKLYNDRSQTAIDETIKKYGKLCRFVAQNILGDKRETEECENDVYLALWNSIPPEQPKNFAAYISRITRNISLSRFDYLKAKKRNCEFDCVLDELSECIPSSYTVEKEFDKKKLSESIHVFLKSKDSDSRIVFMRRYFFSQPVKKIALEFGFSESKIKSMLFRIRNELRFYLEKEGLIP